MFDPTNLPKYDMDQEQLEEFMLFCVLVAGKSAKQTAKALDKLMSQMSYQDIDTPFDKVKRFLQERRSVSALAELMKRSGIGCSTAKSKAFSSLVHMGPDGSWLRDCSVTALECSYGVGPKTSRFFVLHTRPNAKVACLDRHILSYMRSLGFKAPKQTPTGASYARLERQFLEHAESLSKTPAQLDIEVWLSLSKK